MAPDNKVCLVVIDGWGLSENVEGLVSTPLKMCISYYATFGPPFPFDIFDTILVIT